MAKKTLVRGNVKREFGEQAAKIAVDLLGWTELTPAKVPVEVGTKTKPPEIKPVKLIIPPEVKDDKVVYKLSDVIETEGKVVTMLTDEAPEVKKRKPRVANKSTK